MILTDYFLPEPGLQWRYAKQAGVNHGVLRLPETPDFVLDDLQCWKTLCSKMESYGITPLVIEPLPNCLHNSIKLGDEKRDEAIETLLRMFPLMHQFGISVLCFNFMAHVGWCRTSSDIKERGGALVTGFDIRDYKDDGFHITEEQLWENLSYFLHAVVPKAEEYGVRLALHPDDPPVPALGGVSRILTSRANIDRAVHIVDSPFLGITMCQGTYSAMGEDVCECIRYFCRRNKLFYVHFRDIVGDKFHFHETFHDNGQTDMNQAVKTYLEEGFSGPVRVDHVPTMAGEENHNPGYASVGRLFALGYLKGLLEANGAEIT